MSYVAALATLLEMFPTMPREVVEAVLKDHGGNLQAATEALLAASGEDHGQSGISASTSQVWQDEELARAMQAQLDAETGRAGGASWIHDEPRDAERDDSSLPENSLWDNGAEDPFKDWREMAETVGQTLSDGFSMVTDTLSTWLSAPFEDGEEEDPRQRPGSARDAEHADDGDRGTVVTGGGEAGLQVAVHRRAQLRESVTPRTPAAGASSSSHAEAWDDGNKKDK